MVQPTGNKIPQAQLTTPSFDNSTLGSPGLSLGTTPLSNPLSPTTPSFGPPSAGSQLRAFEGTSAPANEEVDNAGTNNWKTAFGEQAGVKIPDVETPPEEAPSMEAAPPKPGESAAKADNAPAAPKSQWTGKFNDPATGKPVVIPEEGAAPVEVSTAEATAEAPQNTRDLSPDAVVAIDSDGNTETAAESEARATEERRLAQGNSAQSYDISSPMLLKRDPVTGEPRLVPETAPTTLTAQSNASATGHAADQQRAGKEAQEQAESERAAIREQAAQDRAEMTGDGSTDGVDATKGTEAVDPNAAGNSDPYDSKSSLMYNFGTKPDGSYGVLEDEQGNPVLKSGHSSANAEEALFSSDAADAIAMLRAETTDAAQAHQTLSDYYTQNGFAEGEIPPDAMTHAQVMDEVNQGVHGQFNAAVGRWRASALAYPDKNGVTPLQAYQLGKESGLIDATLSHEAPNEKTQWKDVPKDNPWPLRRLNGTEAKHLLQSEFLSPQFNPTDNKMKEVIDGYKTAADPQNAEPTEKEKAEAVAKQMEDGITNAVSSGVAGNIQNMIGSMSQEVQAASQGLDALIDQFLQVLIQGGQRLAAANGANFGSNPRDF